jgi:hypothetical protein
MCSARSLKKYLNSGVFAAGRPQTFEPAATACQRDLA